MEPNGDMCAAPRISDHSQPCSPGELGFNHENQLPVNGTMATAGVQSRLGTCSPAAHPERVHVLLDAAEAAGRRQFGSARRRIGVAAFAHCHAPHGMTILVTVPALDGRYL